MKHASKFNKNIKIYRKAWLNSAISSPVDLKRNSDIIRHVSNKSKMNYVSNILYSIVNSLSPRL
jgi:hypothetical protein